MFVDKKLKFGNITKFLSITLVDFFINLKNLLNKIKSKIKLNKNNVMLKPHKRYFDAGLSSVVLINSNIFNYFSSKLTIV